jgi:hypothetical protein
MSEHTKFVFGTDIKLQVAARIQAYVAAKFDDNSAKAAKSLRISRQRLFSYTSGKTLPRPPIFDLILREWGLNLLGKVSRRESAAVRNPRSHTRPVQGSLFDSPITLRNDQMKVVIKRKGPRLVASIEISTDLKIA